MLAIINLIIGLIYISQDEEKELMLFVKPQSMIINNDELSPTNGLTLSIACVSSDAHEYRITGARSRKIFVTAFHVPEPKGFS